MKTILSYLHTGTFLSLKAIMTPKHSGYSEYLPPSSGIILPWHTKVTHAPNNKGAPRENSLPEKESRLGFKPCQSCYMNLLQSRGLLEAQFPISKKGKKGEPAGVNFFKDLRA